MCEHGCHTSDETDACFETAVFSTMIRGSAFIAFGESPSLLSARRIPSVLEVPRETLKVTCFCGLPLSVSDDEAFLLRRVLAAPIKCCSRGFSVGMQLAMRPKFISRLGSLSAHGLISALRILTLPRCIDRVGTL